MGEGERKKDGVCAEADTWWRADYNYREMVGFRAEKAVRETQWHDRVHSDTRAAVRAQAPAQLQSSRRRQG